MSIGTKRSEGKGWAGKKSLIPFIISFQGEHQFRLIHTLFINTHFIKIKLIRHGYMQECVLGEGKNNGI